MQRSHIETMPPTKPGEQLSTKIQAKRKPPASQKHIVDMKGIDARLQRLSDNVLPKSPYIVVSTSASAYRVNPYQANEWRRCSHFAANEERLQYLSFVARDDPMLQWVGGWDDGNGGIAEEQLTQASAGRSGTNSPMQGQVPKKKMTLLDYKNTKASGVKASVGGHKDGEKIVNTIPVKVNGTAVLTPLGNTTEQQPAQQGQKRPIEAMNESKKTQVSNNSVEPPSKKARVEPPPSTTKSEEVKEATERPFLLPPLLSPTLPSNVEEELARLSRLPKPNNATLDHRKVLSTTSATSDKKLPPKEAASETARGDAPKVKQPVSTSVKPAPQSTAQAQSKSNAPKSLQDSKQAPLRKQDAKGPVNGITTSKPNGVDVAKPTGAKDPPNTVSKPEKSTGPSLLLKLKIPKSLRKNVLRILQLPPRSKKGDRDGNARKTTQNAPTETKPEHVLSNGVIKGCDVKVHETDRERQKGSTERPEGRLDNKVAQARRDEPSRNNEKRRREDDPKESSEPAQKRQKAPSGLDLSQKPRTPIPPPFKSPAMRRGSSQNLTPKKDLRSTTMHRISSTDGDVKTPQGAPRGVTPVAPGSAERGTREGRSASNTSTGTGPFPNRGDESASWKAEHHRLMALGRQLKHDAKPLWESQDPMTEKRGIAVAIETILCYMLAFITFDESRRIHRLSGDAIGWRSMLPYIEQMREKSGHIKLMHGLLCQLEAVCRSIVLKLEADKLERDSIPLDYPSPESDGKLVSEPTAKIVQNRKELADYRSKFFENLRSTSSMWGHAATQLPVRKLPVSFPKTWDAAAIEPTPQMKQGLVPKKYAGDFVLPLHAASTGIEAVRAGWSMLTEWCEKEGVKWEQKMEL